MPIQKIKFIINDNYFKLIDTHNKSYLLGFLFFHSTKNNYKLQVSIMNNDENKYLLSLLEKEIGKKCAIMSIDTWIWGDQKLNKLRHSLCKNHPWPTEGRNHDNWESDELSWKIAPIPI